MFSIPACFGVLPAVGHWHRQCDAQCRLQTLISNEDSVGRIRSLGSGSAMRGRRSLTIGNEVGPVSENDLYLQRSLRSCRTHVVTVGQKGIRQLAVGRDICLRLGPPAVFLGFLFSLLFSQSGRQSFRQRPWHLNSLDGSPSGPPQLGQIKFRIEEMSLAVSKVSGSVMEYMASPNKKDGSTLQ